MALCKDGQPFTYKDPGLAAEVRIYSSEKEMLLAWLELMRQHDPDALIVFQVKVLQTS